LQVFEQEEFESIGYQQVVKELNLIHKQPMMQERA
jgi:hypothetical protein